MFAADLEQNNLKVTANASCISFVELFRPMVNCVCLVSSIFARGALLIFLSLF